MLGGERAIRLAADGSAADVTIRYAVTMGVRHPDGATCRIPASATWDGPALAAAREAHGRALEAAVRHAAAAAALRAVEAETLATRYRLRAVRDRWIPRLEQALAEVTLALEEQELGRLRPAAAGRLRITQRRISSAPHTMKGKGATMASCPGERRRRAEQAVQRRDIRSARR